MTPSRPDTQQQAPTPRTDAMVWHHKPGEDDVVRADFARQLERELAEAVKARDLHRSGRAVADGMAESYRKEADGLRERLRLLESAALPSIAAPRATAAECEAYHKKVNWHCWDQCQVDVRRAMGWPTGIESAPSHVAAPTLTMTDRERAEKLVGALAVELMQEHWQEARDLIRGLEISIGKDGAPRVLFCTEQPSAIAPSKLNAMFVELATYRRALEKIIEGDCDEVQVAHEAITPYTPWEPVSPETEARIDASVDGRTDD